MSKVPTKMDELPAQDNLAFEKNRTWFADNDSYKSTQAELEIYKFIALSAKEATAQSRSLLDIGNGGIFIFPIDHVARVEAIDIFVEESFQERYPTVKWQQLSALEMNYREEFDTVVEINTLHHIVGGSVAQTYQNLNVLFQKVAQALENGGRFVVLESTVPSWFLSIYKMIFPLLLKVWPLDHPPTFQFHYRELLQAAADNGLTLREFCWIPKTSDVMSLGFRMKPWMTPIRMAKLIFEKSSQ